MLIGRGDVDRRLRALLGSGATVDLTDRQLLDRFAAGPGAEADWAFAALVERHGPMVLRVARGILADPHDAQDAFQATFLVLVSRARGLRSRDTIGPWLHQVARRTALCQRAATARRRRLDRRVAVSEVATHTTPLDDFGRVLHEEIGRLPERYRAAVVLCDLEGRSHEQAARDLGWPVGTVKSRQARARDRLRVRLARRGVAPALLGPALPSMLPATLIDSTAAAAARFLAPRAIAPGAVAALAREVIGTMTLLHWGKVGSTLLALSFAASGAGLIAQVPAGPPGDVRIPAPKSLPPADGQLTVEAQPGKLDLILNSTGAVEPAQARSVINQVEGVSVITKILPPGAKVREGDVVAELDSADLRALLERQRVIAAQADMAYREARLTREVAEYVVKEYSKAAGAPEGSLLEALIFLAEANLAREKAGVERIQRARERLKDATKKRVGPEEPLDVLADLYVAHRLEGAEAGRDASKAEIDAAKALLGRFEAYTRYTQIKSLQQDVEKARQEETSRELTLKVERARVLELEGQIKACTLKAPIDGLLMHVNDPAARSRGNGQIEVGAKVSERQIIAQVISPADPVAMPSTRPAPPK